MEGVKDLHVPDILLIFASAKVEIAERKKDKGPDK